MNFANTRKKAVSLLLILAMLTVLVAALVPIVSTADGDEIQDLGYQTTNDYTMLDETTSLRFVFTIGRLDYDEVGFVFSKTNSEPTIGNSAYKSVDTVYRSITANGTPEPAPTGRYWAALKVTNIPQSYFDGSIYVRGYVTKDDSTTYSETKEISVWRANATEVKWTSESSNDPVSESFAYNDLLEGGKHFYPDASNGGEGNDLLIEYSLLWNNSLVNLPDSRLLSGAYNQSEKRYDSSKAFSWMSFSEPPKGVSSKDWNSVCPHPGGFETCGGMGTIEYGPSLMGSVDEYYQDYPNIGGDIKYDQAGYEWGWHRVGIRLHQELINESDVKAGESARYKISSTVYIDGARVCKISYTGTGGRFGENAKYALFKAESDDKGGVMYSDSNFETGYALYVSVAGNLADLDTKSAYLVYSDVSVSCGKDFVQEVTKVVTPPSRTYEAADNTEISAKVYYSKPGDPIIYVSNWDDETKNSMQYTKGNEFQILKTIGDALGNGEHYYPDKSIGNKKGSDLLVEFSFLYNETMTNAYDSTLTVMHIQDYNLFNIDLKNGTITSRERLNSEMQKGTGGDSYIYPTPEAIAADGTKKTVSFTGEYGWHRFGVRIHQEAEKNGESIDYSIIVTAYLDGEMIFQIDKTDWVIDGKYGFSGGIYHKNYDGRLWTALIDGSNLKYSDQDKTNQIRIEVEEFYKNPNKAGYLVLKDIFLTCGHDFMQQVEPVATPAAATINLGGVEYPAATYYKLAD